MRHSIAGNSTGSRVGRNTAQAAPIFGELHALQDDVKLAWRAWEETASHVGPEIEDLLKDASRTKDLLVSMRRLRVPDIWELCGNLSSSCGGCAAVPVCGWCTASMRCIPGTAAGPAECKACSRAAYSFGSCQGLSCAVYKSCSTCVTDPNCGWCGDKQGLCSEGSEFGPSEGAAGVVPAGCPAGPDASVRVSAWASKPGRARPLEGWTHRDNVGSQCAPPPVPDTPDQPLDWPCGDA